MDRIAREMEMQRQGRGVTLDAALGRTAESDDLYLAGDTVWYEIAWSNDGDADATDVNVRRFDVTMDESGVMRLL